MRMRVQLRRLREIGSVRGTARIFSIYAQIPFGTNARGNYKYQFAQNIQRDIQLRDTHNRQCAAREGVAR